MKSVASVISLVILSAGSIAQPWISLGLHGNSGSNYIDFIQEKGLLRIVGNGTVAFSSDLGLTWKYQPHRFYTNYPWSWSVNADSFLIASVNSSVIVTTDCGRSFMPRVEGLRKGFTSSRFITGNPQDRSDIWLGYGDVYRTSNFGETWRTHIDGIQISKTKWVIGISPVNPSYICLANNLRAEYFVSFDGGVTYPHHWKSDDRIPTIHAYDMVITPSGNIYSGEYASLDSGRTWRRVEARIDDYGIKGWDPFIGYLYNPKDSMVYVSATKNGGLFRARDGDTVFHATRLCEDYYRQGGYLTIDTTDGTVIAQINDSLYSMRGDSVSALLDGLHMANVSVLRPLGRSGDTLLAGNLWRFLLSSDRGSSWRDISGWWGGGDGHFIVESPHRPGYAIVGTINGWLFGVVTDYGRGWSIKGIGRPISTTPQFDPFDSTYIYFPSGLLRLRNELILNSPNSSDLTPEIIDVTYLLNSMKFDPHNKGVIYGSTDSEEIIRYNDYGRSVDLLYEVPEPEKAKAWMSDFAIDAFIPGLLYASSFAGIYVSSDTGRTWRLSTEGMDSRRIKALLADPNLPGVVYAGAWNDYGLEPGEEHRSKGGVYRSADSGRTWFRLPDEGLYNWNILSMTIAQNPRRLIVGTDAGAYEYLLGEVSNVTGLHSPRSLDLMVHPNPFTGSTTISLGLSSSEWAAMKNISIKIHDALGRVVLDLSGQALASTVTLAGRQLPMSGVYSCRLSAQYRNGAAMSGSVHFVFLK